MANSHAIRTKRDLIRHLESLDVPDDSLVGVAIEGDEAYYPLYLERVEVSFQNQTKLALSVVVYKVEK